MDLTAVETLITGGFTDLGATLLVIFGAVITLSLAVFAVKYGLRKIKGSAK